jgi:hypothetical protein
MEPFGILMLSLVAVLVLGGFGLAMATIFLGGRPTRRKRPQDEGWEVDAERLHEIYQPDEEPPE